MRLLQVATERGASPVLADLVRDLRRSIAATVSTRAVDCRTAARLPHLKVTTLTALRRRGVLSTVFAISGNEPQPYLDRREVEALSGALRSSLPLNHAAKALGISDHGVEQLETLGLLAFEGAPGTIPVDGSHRVADWVAYRVTPASIGPSGTRRWSADPWLSAEETLEPDDYDRAPKALGIDRGHQAPLAAFSGTPFAADTNILSNITPQGAGLNQAPWQRLEAKENELAKGENIAVYVLTGPLFERVMPPLPAADERHRVPSGYWKVVATTDGRVAAFVMDTAAARSLDHCDARVPLEEVELRSRLGLFPRLEPRAFTDLSPALGCSA